VGARGSTILRQFLTEAIVLSTVGASPASFSHVATVLVALVAQWPTVIPRSGSPLGGILGAGRHFLRLLSGQEAANLNPIEALRFE